METNNETIDEMSMLSVRENNGIKSKRPSAYNLQPLKTTHVTVDEPAYDCISNIQMLKKMDIGFTDISYSVKELFKRERKQILHGLNGEFKSGDLTAVMGPSGAGKSTLMDIISGYTTNFVEGKITINGTIRDPRRFRRMSAYIMQDHNLQPLLTVKEAMRFSVNLKLGSSMSKSGKSSRINTILEAIGLKDEKNTRTGNLSGGQKKRLSIALELVDNPPVMIFDEPTSGLDSSMSTQCMSLLKKLAMEGRTIICTIHQPSALVVEMFDHIYAIADGQCIYTGTTKNLFPFLEEMNLPCPLNYSPSDYLLEISTGDYGDENERLVEKTQNGLLKTYRKGKVRPHTSQIEAMNVIESMMTSGLMTPVHAPSLTPGDRNIFAPVYEMGASPTCKRKLKLDKSSTKMEVNANLTQKRSKCECCKHDVRYSASFCYQVLILLSRFLLILKRDRSLTVSRFGIHVIVATFIGIMYYNIGNEAHHMYNNFRYIFFSIMFLMFTAFSGMTMTIPLELPMITREHFNRWYSLKAYFLATSLADLPVQFVCTLAYITITYFLSNQPFEVKRFLLFFLIVLAVTLVAQSLGLLCGSIFSVKNCAVFGPFFICPFLIFSGFFIAMKDAPSYLQWLFHISFFKYALEGSAKALFGYDRIKLICNEMFCQYVNPKKFMRDMRLDGGHFMYPFIALIITFLVFRISAYFVMLYQLKHKR